MTLGDVGEELNISSAQAYALVRSGELPAIQIGGRGQWRVEARIFEEFIVQAYEKSAAAAREARPAEDDENAGGEEER
ncbi:helix-turn-helix domain-containing protein [Paenarthrobacter ureafaciens]|uniref:helix-turn-helix domain-containing protein n=2 Tax=Micrococcaceae TaxID=1268 RepID=UPI0022418237|nr:Helix-turn-helix domain-containing protein [Arthrobacter sp. VKM Ac-2550]